MSAGGERSHFPSGKAAAVAQAHRAPSVLVGIVTAQDAVYHAAEGSSIAGASIVAIATAVTVTIAGATVIDRTIIDRSTAIAAPVSGNTAATGEASLMSATRDNNRMTATRGHSTAARQMCDAGMTTWMAGSQRIRCHWHAADGHRGRKSDERFMKHASLL